MSLKKGEVDLVVRSDAPGEVVYLFDRDHDEGRLARLAVDDVLQRTRGRQDVVQTAEEAPKERGTRYIDFLKDERPLSVRSEVLLSTPFGLTSWQTTAGLRNICLQIF